MKKVPGSTLMLLVISHTFNSTCRLEVDSAFIFFTPESKSKEIKLFLELSLPSVAQEATHVRGS